MLKNFDKKAFTVALICLAAVLIIGVSVIFVSGRKALFNIGKKENIKDTEIEKIQKAELVTIEVDKYNLYETFGNDKKEEQNYGIIIVGDNKESKFMAVKVDNQYVSELKQIKQENEELNNGVDSDSRTTIRISGRLVKMNSRESEWYEKSIYDKWGYEKEEIPYVAMRMYVDGTDYSSSRIWFVVGIILTVMAVTFLIFDIVLYLKRNKTV